MKETLSTISQKTGFSVTTVSRVLSGQAEKYRISEVFIFGSYARDEATENSDIDLLVYGGENFKPTHIFSFAEELRELLHKNVDAFEINEVNPDSDFYQTIMKEKIKVA